MKKKVFSILFALVLVLNLGLVTAVPAGASPDPGLVGLWHFDGDADDSSGNDNDGTLAGDATYATGKFGQALSLDGNGDYVVVADDDTLDFGTGDFTVEAWINVSSSGLTANKEYGVVNKNSSFQNTPGWGIEVSTYNPATGADFGILFLITQGSWPGAVIVLKTSSMTADVWHHIVAVRNGTTIYVYFDGAEVATTTHEDADDNVDNNQPVIIGDHRWGPSFPGLIDEVRIWSVALTATQIAQSYALGTTTLTEATTVLKEKFLDDDGITIFTSAFHWPSTSPYTDPVTLEARVMIVGSTATVTDTLSERKVTPKGSVDYTVVAAPTWGFDVTLADIGDPDVFEDRAKSLHLTMELSTGEGLGFNVHNKPYK